MKKRLFTLLVAITVFVSGCGNSTVSETQSTVSETEQSVVSMEEQPVEKEPEKIAVTDFYQYAMSDWLNSVELDSSTIRINYDDEVDDKVFAEVYELLRGKTVDDYPDNPGMQKLILFSEQLSDSEMIDKGIAHMKSMCETVDNVKNLNEFYRLMEDTNYASMDSLFCRDYLYTDDGDYILQFMAAPYMSLYNITEAEEAFLEKEFAQQFKLMGYGEQESAQKAGDAVAFNHLIVLFHNATQYELQYWPEEDYLASEHVAPLIDIMKELDYKKEVKYGPTYYSFFAYDVDLAFYDKVLTEEYLQMIKAYYEVNMFELLFDVGSYDMRASLSRIYKGLNGYELDKIDEITLSDVASLEVDGAIYGPVLGVDGGHIAKLYYDTYISDETIAEIEEMTALAKEKYIEILKEYDWLSDRVKEKLIMKVKSISVDLGDSFSYSSYEDVEIGSDPVETVFAFTKSNRAYNKRFLETTEGLEEYKVSPYYSNGYYSNDSNSLLLTYGTIKSLTDNPDISYEAKLGLFGSTLTHEIAHALAPNYIMNGVNGIYMDYINDEEYNVIWSSYDTFAQAIAGTETEYGNKINGYRCCNEFFSDVLSVNCSLRMLEDLENPNYDDFFVNFAKANALVLTPGAEESLIRNGNHLMGKTRVNLVLYQFDKFYEVYDIDETSAYYIKPESRVIGY